MLDTANNSIPPKKFSPHKKQGWNEEIRQAQHATQQAYKRWRAAGKPRNSDQSMCIHYKSLKGKFRSLLRQHKKDERESFFASLDLHNTDSRKLFRTIWQKNGQHTAPTTLLISSDKAYEGPEVLDCWASHFLNLASPTTSPSFDDDFHSTTTANLHHILSTPPGEDIISAGEVARAIELLALDKASGPDEIETEHLQFGGPSLILHLTAIFNAIFAIAHTPTPFLHDHIIPIPKGHDKDLRNPSNYRGISLLSTISKVFGKVLINIIAPEISLNPLQGGFRAGYSCLHTAYILQEAIQHTREHKKKAYVAFLDAKKSIRHGVACGPICQTIQ